MLLVRQILFLQMLMNMVFAVILFAHFMGNQPSSSPILTQDWEAVRAQLNLTPDFLHLGAS